MTFKPRVMFRFWNSVAPEQSSLVHSACVRVDGWMTSLAVCLREEIRIHEGTGARVVPDTCLQRWCCRLSGSAR